MYTKITSAKHGASAIEYVLQEKGHYKAERNDMITGVNLAMYSDESVTSQMNRYWTYASEQNKTQVRRIVISFSEKEFSADNPEQVIRATELSRDALSELYPDRQILICTQSDGKGGKLHVHALVNNVSMTEHKGLTGKETSFDYLSKHLDSYFEEHGLKLDKGSKLSKDRLSQAERALYDHGGYSWKDDLYDRIQHAYKQAQSYDEFIEILDDLEVDYDDSKKHNTFTLRDDMEYKEFWGKAPEKPLKARGKSVNTDFTTDELKAHFEALEATRQAQTEQAAPVVEPPAEEPVEEPEDAIEIEIEPEPDDEPFDRLNISEMVRKEREKKEAITRRTGARRKKSEPSEKEVDEKEPISTAVTQEGLKNIIARNERLAKYLAEQDDEKSPRHDTQKQ